MKLFKDKFFEDLCKEHVEFLLHQTKNDIGGGLELCMKEYIEKLVEIGKVNDAKALKKKFKISDRSFYTMMAKAYINTENWTDLASLVKDKNSKKYATIPWFTLVDLLIEKKEFDKAEEYIIRLEDIDEQV